MDGWGGGGHVAHGTHVGVSPTYARSKVFFDLLAELLKFNPPLLVVVEKRIAELKARAARGELSAEEQAELPSAHQSGIARLVGSTGAAAVLLPMIGVLLVGGFGLVVSSKVCQGYAPAATHGDDPLDEARHHRRRRTAGKFGRRGERDDEELDDEEDGLTAMARRNGLD